jgi:hypothetical protein
MHRRLPSELFILTLILSTFSLCTAAVNAQNNVRIWGRGFNELPGTYVNNTVVVFIMLESEAPIESANVSYVDMYGECATAVLSLTHGDRLNGTWEAVMNPEMVAEKTDDGTNFSTYLEIITPMTLHVMLPFETMELPIDSFPQSRSAGGKAGLLQLTPLELGLILLFSVTIPAIMMFIRKKSIRKPKTFHARDPMQYGPRNLQNA